MSTLHQDGVNPVPATPVDRPLNPQFCYGSVMAAVHRRGEGRHDIYLTGELLSNAAAGLAELIAGELAHHPTSCVLHLSAVTLLDAAGASMLTLAAAWAGDLEVSFRIEGDDDGPVNTASPCIDW